jgi:hypothetical protein
MSARLDTVKFNAKINSDEEQVSIFYPYEKTQLFEICREQGLLREREVTDPFTDTSLSYGRLERSQIVFTAYYFTLLVRLYRFLFRLPGGLSKSAVSISDRILASRIICETFFTPMIALRRFLSRHKRLEDWARRVKKTVVGGSPKGAR